ncbi:hypothetical protein ACHAW6_012794 [Cyclotella cf. meneghiniana]
MTETTPLLLSEPAATPRSSLRRETHTHRSNTLRAYPFQQYQAKAKPSNPAYLAKTSHAQKSSTNLLQSHQSRAPTTHGQVSIHHRLYLLLNSLPYKLLCIASPIVSPCCGLCCCFTCIKTSEYGMLERFGKFDRILDPGMHFLIWPCEREAGRVSIRIRQLDLHCETKSRDHVFLSVRISIQYRANSHQLFESFYSLSSPNLQLTAWTLDTLRSKLPQMDLDDIFSSNDEIALDLHRTLNGNMNKYGFTIHHALLTHIQPNPHVKQSMNEMQASKRMKEAMPHKAEARKVELVKEAEAKAERAHLNGIGVARERKALAMGMRDILNDVQFSSRVSVSPKGVMNLLVLTQYFDLLTSLKGSRGKVAQHEDSASLGQVQEAEGNSTLILTHMPETVRQLQEVANEFFSCPVEDVKVANLLNKV